MKAAKALILLLLLASAGFYAEQGPGPNSTSKTEVAPEQALYRELVDKWDRQSAEHPGRGRHDRSPLVDYLERWPKGEYSDRVYLLLLEDGFCQTWAGYPDCGAVGISGYERFLDRFPDSGLRDEIELRMARDYQRMAWLWLNGEGEHSEKWADLFRGQSLAMARRLQKSRDPQISQSALELERKLAEDFPRPIAPIPPQVLRPDYY